MHRSRTLVATTLRSRPAPVARRTLTTSRSSSVRGARSSKAVLPATIAAALAAVSLAVALGGRKELELDAEPGKNGWTNDGGRKVGKSDVRPEVFLCVPDALYTRLAAHTDWADSGSWGRNTHGVASTSTSNSTQIKRPMAVPALSNLILRDLALSATYGVAVDSNGDVLQWGHGYGAPEQGGVEKTLTGKNLVKVVPTEEGKVFGLSKKGEVWVWASDKLAQRAGGASLSDLPRRVEESGWMWVLGKGTLWGRDNEGGVEVLKVHPDVKLERGEKCVASVPFACSVALIRCPRRFTSLSAGASHLLALTSRGRSFALPLCLSANTHGQLGVRSVRLLSPPHPGSSASGELTIRLEPDERLNEMGWEKTPPPPKKLDPLLLPAVSPPTPSNPAPKSDHVPPLPSPSPIASAVEDEQAIALHPDPSRHAALERSIHFCTTLHEIPSLRGVQVVELVAGKRHSLARLGGTMDGRVLGWGMNSYGQLGASRPRLSLAIIVDDGLDRSRLVPLIPLDPRTNRGPARPLARLLRLEPPSFLQVHQASRGRQRQLLCRRDGERHRSAGGELSVSSGPWAVLPSERMGGPDLCSM